jgi:hypothetical protein
VEELFFGGGKAYLVVGGYRLASGAPNVDSEGLHDTAENVLNRGFDEVLPGSVRLAEITGLRTPKARCIWPS